MAVVDNNILSALAKAGKLDLLPSLFGTVRTTPAVHHELRDERIAGFEFVEAILQVVTYGDPTDASWLVVVGPTPAEREAAEDLLDHGLAMADAECMSVASARSLDLVTDDQHLGSLARDRGIEVVDLETLLLAAAHGGLFEGGDEARDVVERLRTRDYYSFTKGFDQALGDALGSEDED